MRRVLVVGDTREVGSLLNELVRMDINVEWARDRKDALEKISKERVFDAVIIEAENGLAEADRLAAELKMTAVNLPVVIAVKGGPLDRATQAGLGLGNIDKVILEPLVVAIIDAYDQAKR